GYRHPADLWRRAGLKRRSLTALAEADAFTSLHLSRRQVIWALRGIGGDRPLPLFEAANESDRGRELPVDLPKATLGEEVAEDYASLRLSLKAHPLALVRDQADAPLAGCLPALHLADTEDGTTVSVAGLVLVRQRPGSAHGVIFATIEDETGTANIVVWTDVFERYRRPLLTARLMRVTGKLQREGIVIHVIAQTIEDRSDRLDRLLTPGTSTGACLNTLARADEVRRPIHTQDFRGTGYHPPKLGPSRERR
ncbi:MAG TPA: error-prone DNA polymerase, partial [Rhodospirillaceae bacterium]|nr:error-prone DNA polymerase [Rhodospirillaceae bacterium]